VPHHRGERGRERSHERGSRRHAAMYSGPAGLSIPQRGRGGATGPGSSCMLSSTARAARVVSTGASRAPGHVDLEVASLVFERRDAVEEDLRLRRHAGDSSVTRRSERRKRPRRGRKGPPASRSASQTSASVVLRSSMALTGYWTQCAGAPGRKG
jgi:hypothetical protein